MPDAPDFRITIRRDNHLRVIDWGPWLATDGPMNTLLHARGRAGVFIADLSVVRADDGTAHELIVHPRCGDRPAHRDRLIAWATTVGYSRVWIDQDVIDIDPRPGGEAEARCTGCRARFVDAGPSFWDFVRKRGAFPMLCHLCGADLPQWSVACESVRSCPSPATIRR